MCEPGECTLSDRSWFYSIWIRVENLEIQKTELDKAIKEADYTTLNGIIRLCSWIRIWGKFEGYFMKKLFNTLVVITPTDF